MRLLPLSLLALAAIATAQLSSPGGTSLIQTMAPVAHVRDLLLIMANVPLRGRRSVLVWEIAAPFDWGEPEPGLPVNPIWFDDQTGIEYRFNPPEFIIQTGSTDDVRRSFAHKYGHLAYFLILTNTERAQWDTFYMDHIALMPRPVWSSAEAFAECFMVTFLSHPTYPTSWGYPVGYTPDSIITTELRRIMGEPPPN